MTTLPLTMAMIALSQNPAPASSADFNNDGVVGTIDLITLTSNIGTACEGECSTDLNNDSVTNQQDVLVLMQLWGAVEGWIDPAASVQAQTDNNDNQQSDQTRDMSWQGQSPVLLDAIYFDQLSSNEQRSLYAEELNQGEQTKEWIASNNLNTQPIAYHGGVDANCDGEYTDQEKASFTTWIEENIPADYTGPICLDMEGPRWIIWNTESQPVMDGLMDFYIEGLEFAQSLRPNAKIGYFGLPKKQHTNSAVQTASIQRILDASTALFPNVYEFNPEHDASDRLQRHIETTIEWVNGQVPVFVQVSPRYRDSETEAMLLHDPQEVMRDQVHAALNAVWSDENGTNHKVSGVSLWDAYIFVASYTTNWSQLDNAARKALWNELDEYHVDLLCCMKTAVDAVCAEAQTQTNKEAIAQAATEEAARVAAAQEEASRLRAERKRQRSRLVRRLNSERTKIRRASSNYRKEAKQYRSARSSFKSKRHSFTNSRNAYRAAVKEWKANGRNQARGSKARSTAWKKFATVRTQYRSSAASWRTNVKSWRASAKSFQNQRSSYRTSRNAWKSTVKTWRTANATWRQTAKTASTLAAVGK